MFNRIIKADPDAIAPFSHAEKESHLKSFVTAASDFSSRIDGPHRKRVREEDNTDSHRGNVHNPNRTTHASSASVRPSAQPSRPAFAPRYPKAALFEATGVISSRAQRPNVPRYIPRKKRVPHHIPVPRKSFMSAPSPRILPELPIPPPLLPLVHRYVLPELPTPTPNTCPLPNPAVPILPIPLPAQRRADVSPLLHALPSAQQIAPRNRLDHLYHIDITLEDALLFEKQVIRSQSKNVPASQVIYGDARTVVTLTLICDKHQRYVRAEHIDSWWDFIDCGTLSEIVIFYFGPQPPRGVTMEQAFMALPFSFNFSNKQPELETYIAHKELLAIYERHEGPLTGEQYERLANIIEDRITSPALHYDFLHLKDRDIADRIPETPATCLQRFLICVQRVRDQFKQLAKYGEYDMCRGHRYNGVNDCEGEAYTIPPPVHSIPFT